MFANSRTSNYYKDVGQPYVEPAEFREKIIMYSSHQVQIIKTRQLYIRLGFETNHNVPDPTSVCCLILDDRVVEYNS